MALSCCKKLSTLLEGITSKHKGDFYCLNCFNSYSTKEKLKKHRNVCENHAYCYVEMPEKKNIKIQLWRKIYEGSIYYL